MKRFLSFVLTCLTLASAPLSGTAAMRETNDVHDTHAIVTTRLQPDAVADYLLATPGAWVNRAVDADRDAMTSLTRGGRASATPHAACTACVSCSLPPFLIAHHGYGAPQAVVGSGAETGSHGTHAQALHC